MYKTDQILQEFDYYFVIKQTLPGGRIQLALSSFPSFSEDKETLPFDTEEDAALYLLSEARKGAIVSYNDTAIARAIIRGNHPLFLYEEKQPDGRLLLSLHESIPAEDASNVAFGSRSSRLVARLLLRRLLETEKVWATTETIQQAKSLIQS